MLTTCLWFDREAEEAANFYVSIFPNSKVGKISRYPDNMPSGQGPDASRAGEVLTVEFELDGKPFLGLNGGPVFTHSEAVSFVVGVHDQAELDRYWDALLQGGGQESQCGWLKDRFGVSWQVTPVRLAELMSGPDRAKTERVFAAMLPMRKLDIAALEKAAAA